MMCADDGCIDHLQRGGGQCASGKRFQDHVPDAAVSPRRNCRKIEFQLRIPSADRATGRPFASTKHRVEHATMVRGLLAARHRN